MTLFEITEEIRYAEECMMKYAEEHDGDVSEFPLMDIMEELEGTKNEKLLGWGVWYKNQFADSEALAGEIKNLTARKKRIDTNLEFIKSTIFHNMDVDQLENSKCELRKIGMKKAVELKCKPDELPKKYQIYSSVIKSEDEKTFQDVMGKLPIDIDSTETKIDANKTKILEDFEKNEKLPEDVRIKDKYLRVK